jgi:type I restriction enzyme M protein
MEAGGIANPLEVIEQITYLLSGEYLRENHPKLFQEKGSRDHSHEEMFHGFDFDGTMLRIGSMNMTLHGVDNPDIRYKDSLAQERAGDCHRPKVALG